MELSDTLATLVRRWHILLLGLLMTGGLGWAVYQAVPTTYEASGSILLMPADTMVGKGGNPYLYLGGMRDALDVLVRRSSSEHSRQSVLSRFDGANYTVSTDPTTQSPIVLVTAQSKSPDDSMALRQEAMATIGRNLESMQNELGISDKSRIRMRELVVDSSATANTKMALQAAIVSVGAGLLCTLAATAFADKVLTRRRARRSLGGNELGDPGTPVTERDPSQSQASPLGVLSPGGATDHDGDPRKLDGPEVVPRHADTPGTGIDPATSRDILQES
jgi:hypothetical protein